MPMQYGGRTIIVAGIDRIENGQMIFGRLADAIRRERRKLGVLGHSPQAVLAMDGLLKEPVSGP